MTQAEQNPVFQLRGSMLAVTVLELEHNDLERLDRQLAAKVERAPQFFSNTPLVLALDRLPSESIELNLAALMQLCRKHGLCPLGLRATHPTHLEAAYRLNLPILPGMGAQPKTRPLPPSEESNTPKAAPPAEPVYKPARIINQPIRGGQQVYTQGDLIVLAPVSPGAELLADGNIHVYAPLRGRALAGIKGNTSAQIFCKQLAAEMISIAGCYKVAEDLRRHPLWGEPTQISLEGDTLNLRPL